LAATIKATQPGLANLLAWVKEETPISDIPPEDFFAKHIKEIEGVGEPMNPCFFTTAHTDPTNW